MEDKRRSLVKAISWRLTGTTDTLFISLLITGNIEIALKISTLELLIKVLLYFLHEYTWNLIPWGVKSKKEEDALHRGAAKALSWRLIGTLVTTCITFSITGHLLLTLSIGALEWFSKLILYYFHENFWGRIILGRVKL